MERPPPSAPPSGEPGVGPAVFDAAQRVVESRGEAAARPQNAPMRHAPFVVRPSLPCSRRAWLHAWQRRLRFGINSLAKHAPPAASAALR